MQSRSHPRHRLHAYAQLSGGERVPVLNPLRNVSLGGACVQTSGCPDLGARMAVRLMFPEVDAEVKLTGEVAWRGADSGGARHNVGIRWVGASVAQARLLDRCLAPDTKS